MYFFFKHTATTDIYPDVPTLSLPDSLPISNEEDPRTPATSETTHSRTSSIFGSWSSAGPMEKNAWNVALSGSEERSVQIQWLLTSGMSRSEEHKSEIQSLMSTSYAVFCLKKNKTKKQIQHTQ